MIKAIPVCLVTGESVLAPGVYVAEGTDKAVITKTDAVNLLPRKVRACWVEAGRLVEGTLSFKQAVLKIIEAETVELSGPVAAGRGYALCVCSASGEVFLSANPERLAAFERSIVV